MRVLITGGAGFIGSHLTEALLSRGDEVLILDDLSTGSSENIRHLKNIPKLNYWIDSVMNKALLAELVDESDLVVHLAGKSTHFPFHEDDDLVLGSTDKGRWSYAASKALDEFLALAYWKERKLPVVIGRFFNTIGPRQTGQYGMVVPNFVRQALEGQPITVFGTGKQSRCFCYVGDTVAALLKLLDAPDSVGQVFNIGSSEEISIEALAGLIKTKLNSSSPICYIPYDKAYEAGFEDMPRRVPSTAKIERCVGWQPSTSLDTTIDLIAEYFRQKQKPLTYGSNGKRYIGSHQQPENTDAAA